MKLRKWSSLDKAEKLGIKKSLKDSFIVFCIITFLLIFASIGSIIGIIMSSGMNLINNILSVLIIILLSSFMISIIHYVSSKKNNINYAYDKLRKDFSKKLAEKMLVRGEPTKVKLIKTRDGYYEDFLLEDLSGRVEYYAVLEENRNIIVIYTKFSDENEEDFFNDISNKKRKHFDFIEMEEFSSFCEIM